MLHRLSGCETRWSPEAGLWGLEFGMVANHRLWWHKLLIDTRRRRTSTAWLEAVIGWQWRPREEWITLRLRALLRTSALASVPLLGHNEVFGLLLFCLGIILLAAIHKLLVGVSGILNFLALGLLFLSVGLFELLPLPLQLLLQLSLFLLLASSGFFLFCLGLLHLPLQVHLELAPLVSLAHLPRISLLTDLELVLVEQDLRGRSQSLLAA